MSERVNVQGEHTGPTAPTSLNGASSGNFSITGHRYMLIYADLLTNSSYRLYFRLAYAEGLAATTLATAECCLTAGDAIKIAIEPTSDARVYWLLTDSAGTAANGGANDYARLLYEDLESED